MNITIHGDALQKLKGKNFKEVDEFLRWHSSSVDSLKLDIINFTEPQVRLVEKVLREFIDTREHKIALDVIELWEKIKQNPANVKVRRLEQCVEVLKRYIATSPGYMLFKQDEEGHWLPFVVTDISFERAQRHDPAHVKVELYYYKQGKIKKTEFDVYGVEARATTCLAIMEKRNYVLATKELIESYEKDVAEYVKLKACPGLQMLGTGMASSNDERYWYRSSVSLDIDGKQSRFVIDNVNESDEDSRSHTKTEETPIADGSFWSMKKNSDDDCDENAPTLNIPLHPILLVFNLEKHEQCWAHVQQLERYVYDKTIGEKLVLPDFQLDLIQLLMQHDRAEFKDIIKGKSGGSIVLCSGIQGTGKTLTAEVFSEKMERPLYVVQSSQLGTAAVELEKELKKILERATRWGAILLIDEADVFIHERGNDINQNAVVGVFLRVLEYYQGILFLTTNRDTLIDDAIVSRCTAQVKFQVPTYTQQVKIWKILAECSSIKLNEKEVLKFASTHGSLTGRDVKGLLKLANLIATQKKEPITAELIKYVMQFKPTNQKE